MELIKKIKDISLLLIFFIAVLQSCKKESDKSQNQNIKTDQISCFIKQDIKKLDEKIFKLHDTTYALIQNKELSYNLSINDKEYYLRQNIESAEIKLYKYNCNRENVLIIEGDDYYSSLFLVYYLENENLNYLGNFHIDQTNVENTGVLNRDFKILRKENKFLIQVFLNNVIKKEIEFTNKNLSIISKLESKTETDFSFVGKWSANSTCDDPIGLNIKENDELIICVEPNQYYIHLIKIDKNKDVGSYKLKSIEGSVSNDVFSEAYLNDNVVAVLKKINNNKIEFNWLGFYNNISKERQYSEPLISKDNPVILYRCMK